MHVESDEFHVQGGDVDHGGQNDGQVRGVQARHPAGGGVRVQGGCGDGLLLSSEPARESVFSVRCPRLE